MKTQRIVLYALAAVAATFAAPVRADDKPVTLARTLKKGDTWRMKWDENISGPADVPVLFTIKTVVKEIKDGGNISLDEINEGGHYSLNGQEMAIPEAPAVPIVRDKTGKLVEMKLDDNVGGIFAPEVMKLLSTLGAPILSDKPVKAGDSWETEAANPAVKDKKVKIKTTFVGMDKVDGKDLWKIKQTAEPATDGAGAKMTYEGTFWLDPENGQEVKAVIDEKDRPSQFGPLAIKTKTTRLKAGEKADAKPLR